MPVYEYRCRSCEHCFEAVRGMSVRNEPTACPRCCARDTAIRSGIELSVLRLTAARPGLKDEATDGSTITEEGRLRLADGTVL